MRNGILEEVRMHRVNLKFKILEGGMSEVKLEEE